MQSPSGQLSDRATGRFRNISRGPDDLAGRRREDQAEAARLRQAPRAGRRREGGGFVIRALKACALRGGRTVFSKNPLVCEPGFWHNNRCLIRWKCFCVLRLVFRSFNLSRRSHENETGKFLLETIIGE